VEYFMQLMRSREKVPWAGSERTDSAPFDGPASRETPSIRYSPAMLKDGYLADMGDGGNGPRAGTRS
jgi:hypothetical protein